MSERLEVPVLVVGGGPVGMTASLLLARHGMKSLVVERRDDVHRAPQAHLVNARSLEILRELGVDYDELVGLAASEADGSTVRFVTRLFGEDVGTLPYERQGASTLSLTPTPLLNLSQHRLEPVLARHVEDEPLTSLRRRCQWESSVEDDDGVVSTIRELATNTTFEVRSRYVLAADGAGSRVRRQCGIEGVGPDKLQSFVMIHFEADLRARLAERPGILYWILDPAALGTFVAHDIDGTWVFMHPADGEGSEIDGFDEPRCRAIVEAAMGANDVPFEIRTISRWTMTAQVAERYRSGRTFLVGDAAHRFPPSGGLGMNTGIGDVHNLVWKIAWVESGSAPASLLDSYEAERRDVAQRNGDHSLTNALRLFELFEVIGAEPEPPLAERLEDAAFRAKVVEAIEHQREHFDMIGLHLGFRYDRGAVAGAAPVVPEDIDVSDYRPSSEPGARLPHAFIERDGCEASTLDLVDRERMTLLCGPQAEAWADAGRRAGLRVLVEGRDFSDKAGAWGAVRGIADDGAILLRPDGHVGWRALRGADAAAGAALTQALGEILDSAG
jgi:2,4-dichlorophenol 6-monooxygenase